MTIPAAMLTVDRDRQFDDWGVSITFRQVSQTYDPQTQQVAETIIDTPLTAIVGSAPSAPTAGTAARHLTDEIQFQIKSEDLPTSTPVPTSRIVYNATEYDIVSFTLSTNGLLYALECRKTS